MKTKISNIFIKVIYTITICLIVIVSFSFYSFSNYPLLNSDDAMSVLMAHYYQLPNDLYCWGQDRGGTIIPFIAQFFIKIMKLSALSAVSLSTYLVLIVGYFGFASLFKTNYSKILFAIIWFLPFQRFIDLLRFPIGMEYSLIACVIFLVIKFENLRKEQVIQSSLIFVIIVILTIITIWVSDLAIVSFIILLSIVMLYHLYYKKTIKPLFIMYFLLSSTLIFFVINYAKSFAIIKTNNYLDVNNFENVLKTIQIIKNSIRDILLFKSKEPIIAIYIYLFIAFLVCFIFYVFKSKLIYTLYKNKWITFFLVDFIIIFCVFLLSSWILANGVGRWYFVASYISLSIFLMLVVEQLTINRYTKTFKIVLVFIVVLGAISPIYSMKYKSPKTLTPMAELVAQYAKLGRIAVIGEFWNSYIVSVSFPDSTVAITNDKSYLRNKELVNKVFYFDNIYIIKDMWLDKFPDTLYQYGHLLLKNGAEFRMAGSQICKYKKKN